MLSVFLIIDIILTTLSLTSTNPLTPSTNNYASSEDIHRVIQHTFINELESSAQLSDAAWKLHQRLQFRFIASRMDGSLMVAITAAGDTFSLHYTGGKLNILLNGHISVHVAGLTDTDLPANKWHGVSIEQVGSTGLRIGLNDMTALLPTRNRNLWMNITRWEQIFFGLPPGNHAADGEVTATEPSILDKSFVGCIDIGQITSSTTAGDLIVDSNSVLDGCIDACEVQSCKNGAKCVNNYNHAICDCKGTGYEGPTCEQKSVALSFDGKSYLTYDTVDNFNLDWQHSIELRFRTQKKEGVILVTSFGDDFLVIELYRKKVFVSARFGKGTLHLKSGHNLNDGRWHYLSVSRRTNFLVLQVDTRVSTKVFLQDELTKTMKMRGGEELVYFGGTASNETLTYSKSKQNLVGCLQQISFNGQEVVNKVLFENDWKFSTHGKIKECEQNNV